MNKISYALGLSIGNNFKSAGVKSLDLADFSKAIEDVFNEVNPAMEYEEAQQVINEFFMQLQKEKLELNGKAGEEFLRLNKNKAGVITLPSGLQYEILKTGEGAKPQANNQVKCHYEGRLIDGRVFDSSIQRGQPATFGLNQVIKGWTEALQLMPVGSKWRLFLPADLAYGSQQAGELIEPNSTLVFEVELLDIV
jgi:FKBP-type peptidyl-prolyl cis-trans isomerases 1